LANEESGTSVLSNPSGQWNLVMTVVPDVSMGDGSDFSASTGIDSACVDAGEEEQANRRARKEIDKSFMQLD